VTKPTVKGGSCCGSRFLMSNALWIGDKSGISGSIVSLEKGASVIACLQTEEDKRVTWGGMTKKVFEVGGMRNEARGLFLWFFRKERKGNGKALPVFVRGQEMKPFDTLVKRQNNQKPTDPSSTRTKESNMRASR